MELEEGKTYSTQEIQAFMGISRSTWNHSRDKFLENFCLYYEYEVIYEGRSTKYHILNANTNSFTSARDRFDYLIEPYLDRFRKDDFIRLIQEINKNNQIYNYSGQRARNNSIIASAKFVLPEDFDYDAYEKFRYTKVEEKPEESSDETDIDVSQIPDSDPELPF